MLLSDILKQYDNKEQKELYQKYKKCGNEKCAKYTKKIKSLIKKNKNRDKTKVLIDIMESKAFLQKQKCKKIKCKKEYNEWRRIFLKAATAIQKKELKSIKRKTKNRLKNKRKKKKQTKRKNKKKKQKEKTKRKNKR